MWVFVNAHIENPTFATDAKDKMTFGLKKIFGNFACKPSTKFKKNIAERFGFIESGLAWANEKAKGDAQKRIEAKNMAAKISGIPELQDANDAGTEKSSDCTLILAAGNAAKTLAMASHETMGRDAFGVWQFNAQLLTSSGRSRSKGALNNFISAIGLQYDRKYSTPHSLQTLRYGKLMIMTDQDQYGTRIKGMYMYICTNTYKKYLWNILKIFQFITSSSSIGLIIKFIHTNWPELLKHQFLEQFIVPHTTLTTLAEAKEYFSKMDRHRFAFEHNGAEDDKHIEMAFGNRGANLLDKRMDTTEKALYNTTSATSPTRTISFTDFIKFELAPSLQAQHVYLIQSMVDGLTVGQRKILYACTKRNNDTQREFTVAALAGSVISESAYYYRDQNQLHQEIINMAANYIGDNNKNINLLMPIGQLSSRLFDGKGAKPPAHQIKTMLSPLTRLIFHPDDDQLLEYKFDENGLQIEPNWYIPILPMILVNGYDGNSSSINGYTAQILNYNPHQIIKCLRQLIDGEEPEELQPWFKNFRGRVIRIDGTYDYLVVGEMAIVDNDKIEITELPIGTSIQTYKQTVLEPLLKGRKKTKIIADYKEHHTHKNVRFVITFAPGKFDRLRGKENGFHRVFQLTKRISMQQHMNAFNEDNCFHHYQSADEILKTFYTHRLKFYAKRIEQLADVGEKTAQSLWKEDLDALEHKLNELEAVNAVANDDDLHSLPNQQRIHFECTDAIMAKYKEKAAAKKKAAKKRSKKEKQSTKKVNSSNLDKKKIIKICCRFAETA